MTNDNNNYNNKTRAQHIPGDSLDHLSSLYNLRLSYATQGIDNLGNDFKLKT